MTLEPCWCGDKVWEKGRFLSSYDYISVAPGWWPSQVLLHGTIVSPLGDTKRLAGVRMSFLQLGWDSGKAFCPQACVFVMESSLGIFHNDYSLPVYAKATRASFLALLCENLVGFLEFKSHGRLRKPKPPQVSQSLASPHSTCSFSSKLPFKCPCQIMAPAAAALGKCCDTGFAHLPTICGGSLTCHLCSLLGPRKVINLKCF